MMRRPSEKRPAGEWKKVTPLGGGACPKAAERPPVSELESPKLNMAGKLHCLARAAPAELATITTTSIVEITTLDTTCLHFSPSASITLSLSLSIWCRKPLTSHLLWTTPLTQVYSHPVDRYLIAKYKSPLRVCAHACILKYWNLNNLSNICLFIFTRDIWQWVCY